MEDFPPYSVGEVKRLGGPSRRDVGHGGLSTRALEKVLPAKEEFDYTIRLVSEVLESNGSSSMGTVCAGTLALMDGGVPIKAPVSGIAMGLVKEGDQVVILSDILGDEDHTVDMDFKVAGTKDGITALQMDIKILELSKDIMGKALEQARVGRLHILDKMLEVIDTPREEISPYAPKIITIKVNPEKIREIIGPGGKVIRSIQVETNTQVGLELICYRQPTCPRPPHLGQANVPGMRHIAFRVTDLDQAVDRLRDYGTTFLSDVQHVPTDQVDYADQRKRIVYCRDPEGNLLELCAFA